MLEVIFIITEFLNYFSFFEICEFDSRCRLAFIHYNVTITYVYGHSKNEKEVSIEIIDLANGRVDMVV